MMGLYLLISLNYYLGSQFIQTILLYKLQNLTSRVKQSFETWLSHADLYDGRGTDDLVIRKTGFKTPLFTTALFGSPHLNSLCDTGYYKNIVNRSINHDCLRV